MTKTQRPPYLLFADDDEDTLELFKFYAQKRNWLYETANTARGIMDKVNAACDGPHGCFDVVVADVNYFDQHPEDGPRLTGITAGLEIRRVHPNMPILFVSAYVSTMIREEVSKMGLSEMIPKPFDFDALFARLEYIIQWNRMAKTQSGYEGLERRTASVNYSSENRRSTDYKQLSVPPVLSEIMSEVRAERQGGAK